MATGTRTQAAEAEANGDDFTFEHKGEEYSLPLVGTLKAGVLRRAVMQFPDNDLGQIFSMLSEIAEMNEAYGETLDALDEMNVEELNDVVKRWQKQSAAGLGE